MIHMAYEGGVGSSSEEGGDDYDYCDNKDDDESQMKVRASNRINSCAKVNNHNKTVELRCHLMLLQHRILQE